MLVVSESINIDSTAQCTYSTRTRTRTVQAHYTYTYTPPNLTHARALVTPAKLRLVTLFLPSKCGIMKVSDVKCL